jgi:hypothetical protein
MWVFDDPAVGVVKSPKSQEKGYIPRPSKHRAYPILDPIFWPKSNCAEFGVFPNHLAAKGFYVEKIRRRVVPLGGTKKSLAIARKALSFHGLQFHGLAGQVKQRKRLTLGSGGNQIDGNNVDQSKPDEQRRLPIEAFHDGARRYPD